VSLLYTKQRPNAAQLHARRHPLNLVAQATPVVRLQLGVLDPLLAPVLMQTADVILALLEMDEFVADALRNEDTPGMLLDNGFFVLKGNAVSGTRRVSLKWSVSP
jgi:hypothetical protein